MKSIKSRTGAVWYQIIFGRVRLRSMTNDLDVSEMFDQSGIDLFIKKLNFRESINAFIYSHSQKEEKKKKANHVMDDHQNTPSPPPSTISIIILKIKLS